MQFSLSTVLITLLVGTALASPAVSPKPEGDPIARHFAVSLPKTPASEAITPAAGDVPIAADSSVQKRDADSDLTKRTPGCVYITSDSNWGGYSAYLCVTNGDCTIFNDNWRYTISSFGPDWGTTCVIYQSADCSGGGSTPFGNPGYGNLGSWNDNMGSFRCWW